LSIGDRFSVIVRMSGTFQTIRRTGNANACGIRNSENALEGKGLMKDSKTTVTATGKRKPWQVLRSRLAAGTFVLAACAAVLAWSFADTAGAAIATPAEALPVAAVKVQQQTSLETKVLYAGTVEANRSSQLAFERPGRILRVTVREGAQVAAGQVLAELDTSELRAQHAQAESQLSQARAVLREFEAGARREVVASARAQVKEAEEQLRLLEIQHERRQDLLRREAISREEMDSFATQMTAQAARAESVRQRLRELEAGTRDEQLDAQRAVVSMAAARLDELAILIEKSRLRAPFAGSIAQRMLDEGAYVGPGTPVLTLLESGDLEVRVGVPADQLGAVREGATQTVVLQGQRVQAPFRRVLPQLDESTRVVPVLFALPTEARSAALPGMLAQLELPRVLKEPGFVLPVSALTRADRGLWACFAIVPANDANAQPAPGSAERLERREVEILHSDGQRAYVRGFLQDGDRVVASGVSRVTDGQRVIAEGN
jgi:RND family efflux transporter MFP subunit